MPPATPSSRRGQLPYVCFEWFGRALPTSLTYVLGMWPKARLSVSGRGCCRPRTAAALRTGEDALFPGGGTGRRRPPSPLQPSTAGPTPACPCGRPAAISTRLPILLVGGRRPQGANQSNAGGSRRRTLRSSGGARRAPQRGGRPHTSRGRHGLAQEGALGVLLAAGIALAMAAPAAAQTTGSETFKALPRACQIPARSSAA